MTIKAQIIGLEKASPTKPVVRVIFREEDKDETSSALIYTRRMNEDGKTFAEKTTDGMKNFISKILDASLVKYEEGKPIPEEKFMKLELTVKVYQDGTTINFISAENNRVTEDNKEKFLANL